MELFNKLHSTDVTGRQRMEHLQQLPKHQQERYLEAEYFHKASVWPQLTRLPVDLKTSHAKVSLGAHLELTHVLDWGRCWLLPSHNAREM